MGGGLERDTGGEKNGEVGRIYVARSQGPKQPPPGFINISNRHHCRNGGVWGVWGWGVQCDREGGKRGWGCYTNNTQDQTDPVSSQFQLRRKCLRGKRERDREKEKAREDGRNV